MESLFSRLKTLAWKCTMGQKIHRDYHKTLRERTAVDNVMTSEETIQFILEHRCSVARFGDGEFQMVAHGRRGGDSSNFQVDSFQPFSQALSDRLTEVMDQPCDNLLVCVPFPMLDSRTYRGHQRFFFEREWLWQNRLFTETARHHRILGDTTFTRFYLNRTDIPDYSQYIHQLKEIWKGQSVILIEGEKSRLGVGNDLFDQVASMSRILCPATDAFSVYDRILSTIKQTGNQNHLYLLALGHSATVLAYDLARMGYRAIDIGHIDIEYEWYRMQAKEKCPVPGKYVNEVQEGRLVQEDYTNQLYESQIIEKILL